VNVRAARPTDGAALALLFSASSCPCHCRYFHFDGDKNDWLARCADGEINQRELDQALKSSSDEARGVVALDAERIVGWMKVAPAAAVAKAYAQRLYRGLPCFADDRTGVYLIGCALVHPEARKRGVATLLVQGAVLAATSWGARAGGAASQAT